VYQISGQSVNVFVFYGKFVDRQKEENNKKKIEDTQPIFEGSYLGKTWRDLVEIWNAK